uniref:Uncharacterized protein n=1 Tax=Chromera velia CCMP2878 TaxID=1169474 RepID=A0A0G4H971_9ALVE|eukprot:Cvel_5966.t1-p1 / transcript=Cvel_5966.t1 / gene=Cvel_5966 / organism=Chromera_velia_CCMP2878 / gene_product=hypothetical protein / transcript_product=hypothetical protein / location=Cvel_scaffold285:99693-100160(+) / protein_length=156 / sequence_SO=supercontig / SO=protein_coding / is_pseudo=false
MRCFSTSIHHSASVRFAFEAFTLNISHHSTGQSLSGSKSLTIVRMSRFLSLGRHRLGFAAAVVAGLAARLVAGLVAGLAAGLVAGLAAGLVAGLIAAPAVVPVMSAAAPSEGLPVPVPDLSATVQAVAASWQFAAAAVGRLPSPLRLPRRAPGTTD